MKIMVVTNLFLDLRFQNMLKCEFGITDNLLHVFQFSEMDYKFNKNKLEKFDLCIVWINLLKEYPELEEDVIFGRYNLKEAVEICKNYLSIVREKLEYLSLNQIWIQQDQFWRKSWNYFPYQLNSKGIINSLCSLIPEILPSQYKIVEINDIIADVGIKQAYDRKKERRWGNPYSRCVEQMIIKSIKRLVPSTKNNLPKCIILDCDNVLWGGIVSEIGIDKIELGNEGNGLKYRNFQRVLLNLYLIGIIIVLCSKNDYDDVKEVFTIHTGMLLKWDQIAATKINWRNKAENIGELLNELCIDKEDALFVDDCIEEIELVKAGLSGIKTLQFHSDNILEILDYFVIDSNFDLKVGKIRQETYLSNSKRKMLCSQSSSYEEFLLKLDTKLEIHEIMEQEVERISELSKRTNRCTIGLRYTSEDIRKLMDLKNSKVFVVTAKDIFSELGIVGGYAIVDNCIKLFCLSCRILGRNLERMILKRIVTDENCNKANFILEKRNKWMIDLLSEFDIEILPISNKEDSLL